MNYVLAILLLLFLSSCTQKQEGQSIVIPPGMLVEYSNEDFLKYSKSYYTIELQRYEPINRLFFTLQDLTPVEGKDVVQQLKHILPKDQNEAGVFILKVLMTREGVTFSSFILGDQVNKPNVVTTLAVDLLSNYPGFDMSTLKDGFLLELQDRIAQSVARAQAEFNIQDTDFDIKTWLRFLKNYTSRDEDFIDFLEDYGIEFDYNSNRVVEQAPYPFGQKNSQPILDTANSTSATKPAVVLETAELVVRGIAQDSENDVILYRWFKDGVYLGSTPREFRWTPGYSDYKATPYEITLEVTDGSLPRRMIWQVNVLDNNRVPEVTYDCPKNVTEWELWTCQISVIDFDEDPVTFTVSDKRLNARLKVDGQKTDDVTRAITIVGKDRITLEVHPNNSDAFIHSLYLEVKVDDGKQGIKTVPIVAAITDVNLPPQIVMRNGSPIQPMPGSSAAAHEWDYCSNEDPDGFSQPFRFMVEIRDPDNQIGVAPRNQVTSVEEGNETVDVISVSLGGSLIDLGEKEFSVISEAEGCPITTNEVTYFCYEWKPGNENRSGSLTLTMMDNHGGLSLIPSASNPDPIILVSEDRNQRPCLSGLFATNSMLSDILTFHRDAISGSDADGDSPYPELYNVPYEVMPLLTKTSAGTESLIFKRTYFDPASWGHRLPKETGATVSAEYFTQYSMASAGVVVLSRSSPHSSSITIPAGTLIQTDTASFAPGTVINIDYEVKQTVVLEPYDLAVAAPVVAIHRGVLAAGLNRFVSAAPFGLTVTNLAAIDGNNLNSTAVFERTLTGTDVSIPAGTIVGTTETDGGGAVVNYTVRYETIDDVVMKAGVGSVNVRIRRLPVQLPANKVLLAASFGGPSLTASNPLALEGVNFYTLKRDLNPSGVVNYCWKRRLADSQIVNLGSVLSSGGIPSGAVATAQGALNLGGVIRITRTDTSSAFTVVAGARFNSENMTKFEAISSVTMSVGVSSVDVYVRRVQHQSPTPTFASDQLCYNWSDYNYAPEFLMSNSTVEVREDNVILGYEIAVSDNKISPLEPRDWLDRHVFDFNLIGNTPAGSLQFCRTPATSAANMNDPICEPCSTPKSSYYASASCFMRFAPDPTDASSIYNFTAKVNDNGLNFPDKSNERQQGMSIVVLENNVAPIYSDSSYGSIANNTRDTSYYLGNFVEGIMSDFYFYATDQNRGTDLKRLLLPTITNTYQFISPVGWSSVTLPSGMAITASSAVNNPDGIGSKSSFRIRWTPNDYDAKRFAGSNGLVIEVKTCDVGTSKSPALCTLGYFRFTTENINNNPTITTAISTVTMQANLYQALSFNIADGDYAVNSTMTGTNSSFVTEVYMCPGAAASCQVSLTDMVADLRVYDEPYLENASVALCQSGGVLTAYKYPWLFRTSTAIGTVSGVNRNFTYQIRWCPQKRHIGTHKVFLNYTDNGDEDIRGPTYKRSERSVRQAILMKIIAPVFFESPLRNPATGNAVNWMQRAFSLAEYRYELLFNNSRGNLLTVTLPKRALVGSTVIGSPVLELRNKSAPTVVVTSHINTISGFNPATMNLYLVWKPYGCTTAPVICNATIPWTSNPSDPNTFPLFNVTVRDQTTAETETVAFRVEVAEPFPNSEPTIMSVFPLATEIEIPEQAPQTFSAVAHDPDGDPLTYRWSLNGNTVWDRSGTYVFNPSADAAFLPATSPGVYKVEVQVLDGKERPVGVKQTWIVRVKNTVPLPQILTWADAAKTRWTLPKAVVERGLTGAISNINWGPTVGVTTKSGTTFNSHLLFTGSYLRASVTRHFVWRIPFVNSYFTDNTPTSGGQGAEILPWAAGRTSQQISYQQDAATLQNVLVSSQPTPNLSFVSTSDAVKLSPTLASISSLSASNVCSGVCPQTMYSGAAASVSENPIEGSMQSAGTSPGAAYTLNDGTKYYFYTDEMRTTLQWGLFGSSPGVVSVLSGNDRIADIAVNPRIRRLYMSVQDPSVDSRSFIYVYNLDNVTSGSVPLAAIVPVSDGVNLRNRILDLAVDSENNKVYAALPGSGGVAVLDDDGYSVLDADDVSFIGIGAIGPSLSDTPGSGRKLVYNVTTKLLYGLSRDSSQVYIIDPQESSGNVNVFGTDTPADEVVTFAQDGLTLAIDRASTLIYLIR